MFFPNFSLISRFSLRFPATFPPLSQFRSKGNKGSRVLWGGKPAVVVALSRWCEALWLVVQLVGCWHKQSTHTQYTHTLPGGWWQLGG